MLGFAAAGPAYNCGADIGSKSSRVEAEIRGDSGVRAMLHEEVSI